MSAYSNYFLGSSPAVVQLECIQITHPRFSQPYRFCRNCTSLGVTVVHEAGSESGPTFYQYLPMQIRRLGSTNNLDQVLRISLGDVSQILPSELDLISDANGFNVKPILKYRTYRSDTPSSTPLFGPSIHEIAAVSYTKQGMSFDATARRLNLNRTGKIYEVSDIPMMTAFFKNSL